MDKFLIAGLGNPGTRYAKTRHNAGTDLVNLFTERNSLELKVNKSLKGKINSLEISKVEVFFLVPDVFMNHSGKSLKPTIKKLNIELEKVLIIHDDLDLPTATWKIKSGGGDGDHNVLKRINQRLGAKKDFKRMRLGIGHPGNSNLVNKYVVQKGSLKERQERLSAIENGIEVLEFLISGNWDMALNILHSK